jgi:hypothetical protein
MVDLRTMSDDETIELLDLARGNDRELLIMTLGFTSGESGVPVLRAALDDSGRGSTHRRTSAMAALAIRLQTKALPDLVPRLSGGNLETQIVALGYIAKVDDGQASAAVMGWLRRRLRAKGRANTYGSYEISGILRYAIRVGALQEVLAVLEEDRDRLQPEERKLLDRAWSPDKRRRYLERGSPADGPNVAAIQEWYLMSAADLTDEEELAFLEEEVGPVIDRLRRRRQRQTQGI